MEEKISQDERRLPYPPDYEQGLVAHFRFNIGDAVQARGFEFSGVVVCAAVNHTGGFMYEIDNGQRQKWLAEDFLRHNRPICFPPLGPQPLRREGDA